MCFQYLSLICKYYKKNEIAIKNGINCDHHVPDPPLIMLLKHKQIPFKSHSRAVADKMEYLKLLMDLSQKCRTPIKKQTVLKAIKVCKEEVGDGVTEIVKMLERYAK